MRTSVFRVQQLARKRAESQARRIPWQQLHESCNRYIEWQEFFLWIRSIIEVEGGIPNWLAPVLDERCPGFLPAAKELAPKEAKARPLALRLEDWIDEHAFAAAKEQGWFNAITYYSVRDPRYQRAEVCWSSCVKKWKKDKPVRYPSFEEWRAMALQCDGTAHLLARERTLRSSFKLVDPDRLSQAVSCYIDLEALSHWAQLASDHYPELPNEVVVELDHRYPGFLGAGSKGGERESSTALASFEQLMNWGIEHYFQDAKAEGWFDAVLVQAQNHPRAIRTREYVEHCKECRGAKGRKPFPSFEQWRQDADSYIEGGAGSAL